MSVENCITARCAGCGWNFTPVRFGRQSCPHCHMEIILEPIDGVCLAPEESPVDLDQPGDAAGSLTKAQDKSEDPSDVLLAAPLLEEVPSAKDLLRSPYVPPWEKTEGNWVVRFFSTIKDVYSFPGEFFAQMPRAGMKRPFLFGWLLCTIAMIFFSIYGLWVLEVNREALLFGWSHSSEAQRLGLTGEEALGLLAMIFKINLYFAPLMGLLNLFGSSLLNHLGVVMLSREHLGFSATFRATAYGFSPMLLVLVPLVGHFLGGLWTLIMQIWAVRQVHRLNLGRAVLAVLLPMSTLLLLFWQGLPLLLGML